MIPSLKPKLSDKEFFILGALIIGFVVLGVGAFFGSIQDVEAVSPNGKFYFQPSNGNLQGCSAYSVDVMVELNEGRSSAADLIVNYNPSKILVTSVTPGQAYQLHAVNKHDPANGVITVNGLSLIGGGFNGTDIFLNIAFESLPGTTTADLRILFDGIGSTVDSNIADSQTSMDLLQQVTNGNYAFNNIPCEVQPTPESIEAPVEDPLEPVKPKPNEPTKPAIKPDPVVVPPSSNTSSSNSENLTKKLESVKVREIVPLEYEISVRGGVYSPDNIPDITVGEVFTVSGVTQKRRLVEVVFDSQEHRFSATSDARGGWSITVDSEIFRVGAHTVQVQTISSNGQIQFTPVDSFHLVGDVPDGRQRPPAIQSIAQSDKLAAWVIGGMGVLLTILGVGLTFEIKNYRVSSKKNT